MIKDIFMWSGIAIPIKKTKMDKAEFWQLLGMVPPVKGATSGVLKMEISLLPDLEVTMGSHNQRFEIL